MTFNFFLGDGLGKFYLKGCFREKKIWQDRIIQEGKRENTQIWERWQWKLSRQCGSGRFARNKRGEFFFVKLFFAERHFFLTSPFFQSFSVRNEKRSLVSLLKLFFFIQVRFLFLDNTF